MEAETMQYVHTLEGKEGRFSTLREYVTYGRLVRCSGEGQVLRL
jgi:hypothetical protein